MGDRRNTERRALKERRSLRSRKRQATESVVVVELAESALKALIVHRKDDGSDEVEAVSIQWRYQAHSLHSDQGRDELAVALRSLAEKKKIFGAPIHFVLGGRYCVTKVIQGATDQVRSELQQLQQRSRLYLRLGPGEKVTVSNSRSLDARHSYAIASVCNAKTLDVINSAVSKAGMEIESIEPGLVASTRAIGRIQNVPETPCLVIHLEEDSVEIGVALHGRLLLEYRPGFCKEAGDLVEMLSTHLGRLERHVGRQLGMKPPRLQKIYLYGEPLLVRDASNVLSTVKTFDAQEVTSQYVQATWNLIEDPAEPSSLQAIGGLLGTYLAANERESPNFVDHLLAISREPLKPVLVRSFAPLAAVLLLGASMLLVNFYERSKLNDLRAQLRELAPASAKAEDLRVRLTSVASKHAQLNQLAAKIPAPLSADLFRSIGQCMPGEVWLNSLNVSGVESLELTGSSYMETGVFDFVRWLELAPGIKDVALRSTQSGVSSYGSMTSFDVAINLSKLTASMTEDLRNE